MSYDIEHKVVYDETVEAIIGFKRECPKTRTVITVGDDGFAQIEKTIFRGSKQKTIRFGLTPPMLAALAIGERFAR